jgi:DNA replication ATP-dependent helicase Dna2
VTDPGRRVLFLDTDGVPCRELRAGENISNEGEATVAMRVVESMLQGGVPMRSIGVISPYRSQVRPGGCLRGL